MNENIEFNIFDEIFKALNGASDDTVSNGLESLASILTLSNEAFEELKPILISSIETTFYSPEAQIAFAQMMNLNGVRIEDFANNMDELIEKVGDLTVEDIDLSDSKKDFLKLILILFIGCNRC